jgi:Ice-binding-like
MKWPPALTPGVYCFDSSAQLTGTLILDAQGSCDSLFVFQTGSTLTTSVASEVIVTNNPCVANCRGGDNVFFQVGSSATIGTGSQFVGNIVANTSVTLNFNASVAGSVFGLIGAVTLDSNQTPPAVPTCRRRHPLPPLRLRRRLPLRPQSHARPR